MGFVSMLEDIMDRHAESEVVSWRQYVGSRPTERDVREARDVLGDPFERPKKAIRKFWNYYQSSPTPTEEPRSMRWELHVHHLHELERILQRVLDLDTVDRHSAWAVVCEVEQTLRSFLNEIGQY